MNLTLLNRRRIPSISAHQCGAVFAGATNFLRSCILHYDGQQNDDRGRTEGHEVDKFFRFLLRLIIRCYQVCLSGLKPPSCRFYPSCSHYADQCYQKYPFFKATKKTMWRLCRCHPWNDGGVDLP